jgi:hypothetical protein
METDGESPVNRLQDKGMLEYAEKQTRDWIDRDWVIQSLSRSEGTEYLARVFQDGLPILGMAGVSDERLEYLRLLLFAADDEWIGELSLFHDAMRRLVAEPTLNLPPNTVDRIAWALDGAAADDDLTVWSGPSIWREGAYPSVSRNARTRVRAEQLAAVHGMVARHLLPQGSEPTLDPEAAERE